MVWVSFGVNVVLTVLKLVALILSGSLAVFASFLDSVLDLLSGSILFITERVSSRQNVYKYPIGRGRMEGLAVIGFSAAMFAATGQVLVKGVEDIMEPAKIKISLDAVLSLSLSPLCPLCPPCTWSHTCTRCSGQCPSWRSRSCPRSSCTLCVASSRRPR